ncbi:MAG: hypothetical protein Q7R47_04935 [Candidatus Diapherotrites archaeon]|nr:hypothetical protein [Candidatus Diapherotrites archaeon]
MSTHRQYLDLASERFAWAERAFGEEDVHTASHLFINAAINYHSALCQKFLQKIPRLASHADMSYFIELQRALGPGYQKYRDAYGFLTGYKGQADYGVQLSGNIAKQIQRKARALKEIAEPLLG